MRVTLPYGEYKPDDSAHALPALSIPGYPASERDLLVADGAYVSSSGYRPIGSFSAIATALSGTFKGGGSFIGTDGTPRMIAGSATDLYSGASGSWSSVIGMLSVSDRWRFTQFGDTVVCVNGGEPIGFDIVANTAGILAGSPPTASFCATVRDFVVLGRADGAQNVVQWSEQGSDVGWTVGTLQAGLQPLYAGGKIMGLTSGELCYIIQRFQITRMSYTADATNPWQFDVISSNDGCKAEGSVIQAGALFFHLTDRGFVMFDGASFKPIGAQRVDATFAAAYSDTDLVNIWGVSDPVRTLAIWVINGRMWMYNWVLDRWTIADVPATAAFPSFTSSVSIDALDAIYGNLDTIPYSLDDARFSGGAPKLTVVHNNGSFGTLTGSNIAAMFGMPFQELAANREARVQLVRPITDAVSGLTLSMDCRQRIGDGENISTFTALNSRGDLPARCAGRSIKPTLAIAAGTPWDFVQGLEVEFAIGGRA